MAEFEVVPREVAARNLRLLGAPVRTLYVADQLTHKSREQEPLFMQIPRHWA